VDSAETTAECVRKVSNGGQPTRLSGQPGSAVLHTFLVTDAAERFRRIASEFLEQEIESLELVSF